MKTFKVKYKEVIMYEFYVDAESKEQVENEFNKMIDNHQIDFCDGEMVDSDIDHIEEECDYANI